MIITLPSDSHIHHIFSAFLSHGHIPSNITLHILANSLQASTKNSFISLFRVNSFEILKYVTKAKQKNKKKERKRKERGKEKGRRKRKKKREIEEVKRRRIS